MIWRSSILLLISAFIATGEPAPVILTVPATGQSWLGVQLAKADPSTSAHIPSLPPGIGFVVKSVDAGGPAELAKLQPFDVVWKMGDQMLINEAQLATLLRLSKPGDEVLLTLFRGGQQLTVPLKLGDLPIGKSSFSNDLADAAILPNETGPMRVINVAERTASYATEEGKAVLRREGDVYLVVIRGPAEQLIFEGDVTSVESVAKVPQEWQRRVCALRRGLDHAIDGRMIPVRPPRPRVVPGVPPRS